MFAVYASRYGNVPSLPVSVSVKSRTPETRSEFRPPELRARRVRKGLGLSQEKLAFETKLDRTYVSLVERQKRNISISVLARLAKALKVRAAELVEPPPKRR